MPIQGISDIVRLPRLGKIHLGEKVERPGKSPYPRATDHFVVPQEVARVYGDKPKELEIMFPTEDPGQFSQQWLRAYSLTQGLVCLGDGETCRRKVDTETGAAAGHQTRHWEWKDDLPCNPQDCPEYLHKRCRRVMNLQFLLPTVPGLGVWQIDTSSFYSIVNINNMVRLLKAILGRCSMVPLTLALGSMEVAPLGQAKKTVYVMHIKQDTRLADLARVAQLPPARVLIPEPEAEEPPEDLFPTKVLTEEAPPEEGEKWQGPEPMTDEEFVAECMKRGYTSQEQVYGKLGAKDTQDLLSKMTYEDALACLPIVRTPAGTRSPSPAEWNRFWTQCSKWNIPRGEVPEKLGMSPQEFVSQGGTLEQALQRLDPHQGPKEGERLF